MTQQVVDNPTVHRYELIVDGMTAFVTYERVPGRITFTNTEVPPAISGRGVASTLTRTVLEIARSNGEKVVSKCSFISAFIRRHAEFQDLLANPLP